MNPTRIDRLTEGAKNLLHNCARLKSGETLLIIEEDTALGWYDCAASDAVAREAVRHGVTPTRIAIGSPGNELDPKIETAVMEHDCTIYFSRVGDQLRFESIAPGRRSVMCYTRTGDELASEFGRAGYCAFKALKEAVNEVFLSARSIEISCPLGTRYSGRLSNKMRRQPVDVSVLRFPVGIHLPIDATEFSGRIALAHYLTPTGSRSYEPASVSLAGTVVAEVERGRIIKFRGHRDDVTRVRDHYARVANQFAIDPDVVHSWHAGIHPGCGYAYDVAENPDRWSNTVFSSPRVLHFHTCGNYAPGEISWMVLDPTITLDGKALWRDGQLKPEVFAQTKKCLESWPQLQSLFDSPVNEIGRLNGLNL